MTKVGKIPSLTELYNFSELDLFIDAFLRERNLLNSGSDMVLGVRKIISTIDSSSDINAFCKKISENEYKICVTRGMICEIFDLIKSHEAELSYKLKELQSYNILNQSCISTYLAITFIFCHEYAHVVSGHLDYLEASGILQSSSQLSELRMSHNTLLEIPEDQPRENPSIYNVECDADITAADLMSGEIRHVFRRISRHYGQKLDADCVLDLISTVSFSIHTVFWYLESLRQGPSSDYPRCMTRSTIISKYLRRAFLETASAFDSMSLGKVINKESVEKHLLIGYRLSNDLAHKNSLNLLNYEPINGFRIWENVHLPKIIELQRLLIPYAFVKPLGSP